MDDHGTSKWPATADSALPAAVEERITLAGGVARTGDVAPTGAGRRQLRRAVDAGRVIDLGGGWYATREADVAFARARRLNAVVTCVSAARFYALPEVGSDDRLHLSVPRERGERRRPGRPLDRTVIHRERDGGAGVYLGEELVPVAPPAAALARALRCCPGPVSVAMVDAALRMRLVEPCEVEALLCGPGSPRARALLGRADPRSRSGIETLARMALQDAGHPVRAGVWIDDVGEVDLLIGHVVVECDGFAYHSGRHEYREDRRRDRELVARGYVVLRFTYEEIVRDPYIVVRAVERALAAA